MFITTDPGKGLITGKCQDLGKMKVPILRGLASRAPLFPRGQCQDTARRGQFLQSALRYQVHGPAKADLVNYLSSL